MKKTEEVFLSVVRSAIGTETRKGPVDLSPNQWQELFELSVSQMLAAVVYGEISRLGSNIPESVGSEWKSHVDFCRAKFDAQLLALSHLAQVLEEHGISIMVLKGVGLSLLYPNPQDRECSDIDIYCFGAYDRVNELLKDKGLISGIEEENDKHCSFMFDGVNVENHRQFCEYINSANILTGEAIEALSEVEACTDPRLPGILFPNPEMGVRHLMMHTLSHLAWSGVSLRHLLDCGLNFRNHASDVRWTEVFKLWEDAGTADAARVIIGICKDTLGLDVPELDVKWDRKDAGLVLDCTLHPFGRSAEVRDPLRKLCRKARQFRIRKKLHMLVYKEPFPDSFLMSFSVLKRFSRKNGETAGNGQPLRPQEKPFE